MSNASTSSNQRLVTYLEKFASTMTGCLSQRSKAQMFVSDRDLAALKDAIRLLTSPVETSDRIGWCGDASGSPFGPTEPPDDVEPDQPMLQGPGGKLIGHLPDQLLDVHAICDERDRLRLQLQRARILLEEAPLHRYGNEYLQWCEKRRLQNAGLNAATCEHPPEWRSHGKCGICLQDVTPLEPSRNQTTNSSGESSLTATASGDTGGAGLLPAASSPDQLCKRCRHSYAQHTKGAVPDDYCRHCVCPAFVPYSPENGGAEHGD